MSVRLITYLACLACLLLALVWGPAALSAPLPQVATLDDATHAVVRIRGCNVQGCNQGVGSGVFIDASGLILTAHHVTLSNPLDSLSPQLLDFVIEVTESARTAPTARYRARIVAQKPDADIALLRIYWDEAAGRVLDPAELDLRYLTLADPESVAFAEELTILGYPLAGGRSINYASEGNSGFDVDEGGRLLKVQKSLSEGNSGGPALVQRQDGYEIAGVVIERRGTLGEVGLIRSIGELHDLEWKPSGQRAVVSTVELSSVPEAEGSALVVQMDLRLFDLAGHPIRLLAYAYDGKSMAPYRATDPQLISTMGGQIVLSAELPLQSFVERLGSYSIELPALPPEINAQDLAFRLALWDVQEGRLLWGDSRWRTPQAQTDAALATQPNAETPATLPGDTPNGVPTPASTDTSQPTPTETATMTPTPAATETATIAPTPTTTDTPQPTPTETPTLVPTPTATDTPQPTPTETPTVELTPLPPIVGTVREFGGVPFVYVPEGEFLMGSTDEQVDQAVALCQQVLDACERNLFTMEQPPHIVYLDSYWIMQTEVSNALWRRFMEAGGYDQQDHWSADGWEWRSSNNITQPDCWDDGDLNADEQPVVCVSWYEAEAFANWLSVETGLEIRLPTEAEWEKAARGADGRIFPWGDDWDAARANYCDLSCADDWRDQGNDDGYALTAPVGSYPGGMSPNGALDMAGNVWEWVADWYAADAYQSSPTANPTGPNSGDRRVVRGGAWYLHPLGMRVAGRLSFDAANRNAAVGLRLASPWRLDP